jgi:hypothetical protein
MALLLKAEEIKGLISIEEAINAVENGFRDQARHPQFSLPRQRMMAGDRRINIHSGGCVDLVLPVPSYTTNVITIPKKIRPMPLRANASIWLTTAKRPRY